MLIGFMGAGKTTVSTRLSKDMSLPEIDMDAYIVKSQNMKISEILINMVKRALEPLKLNVSLRL